MCSYPFYWGQRAISQISSAQKYSDLIIATFPRTNKQNLSIGDKRLLWFSCKYFGRKNILPNGKFAAPLFFILFGNRFGTDGDITESSHADNFFEFFDRRSTRHSAGIHFIILLDFFGEFFHDDDIRNSDAAARF